MAINYSGQLPVDVSAFIGLLSSDPAWCAAVDACVVIAADVSVASLTISPAGLVTITQTDGTTRTASITFPSEVKINSVVVDASGVLTIMETDGTVHSSAIAFPPETTLAATDSNTIDFTTSGMNGHSLTGDVKISATPGSVTLSANADGLAADFTETPLVVVDSNTIDLTPSGTNNHTITADVRIDNVTPGNVTITSTTNGLAASIALPADLRVISITPSVSPGTYTATLSDGSTFDVDLTTLDEQPAAIIPPADSSTGSVGVSLNYARADHAHPITVTYTAIGSAFQVDVNGVSSSITPPLGTATEILGFNATGDLVKYTPTPETSIAVTDTATIDLTSSGAAGHIISADVKISATPGSVTLSVNPDGLAADFTETPETALVATDSNTIDFTTSGANGHALTGDVKISATSGSVTLSVNADGLAADFTETPETDLVATDSNTINFTTSGANGHALTGDVKISATPGNVTLTTNPDGLTAAFTETAETALTANDSATIDFTTSGTAGHTITGDVRISAAPGNVTLVANPDGLTASFVETAETAFVATDSNTIDFTTSGVNGHMLTGTVRIDTITPGNVTLASTVNGLTAAIAFPADIRIVSLVASGIPGHYTATMSDSSTFDVDLTGLDEVPATATPLATTAGGAVGVSAAYAREDHQHPTPVTTVAYTAAGSAITVTVNGVSAAITPAAGIVADFLGFDAVGGLVTGSPTPETALTVNDSATVNLATSGTNGHTLTADVKLSASPGNVTLAANPDGLAASFVETVETTLTATDSSTIDFTTSGVNGHDLTGVVKISATPGNVAITASPDGLTANVTLPTVPAAADATPLISTPAGAIGVSTDYAREDHRHPTTNALTVTEAAGISSTVDGVLASVPFPLGTVSAILGFNSAGNPVRQGKIITQTATIDFPNTAGGGTSVASNVAVSGAAVGDIVIVTPPAALADRLFTGAVTAAGNVAVRFLNHSNAGFNPASGAYSIAVIKL